MKFKREKKPEAPAPAKPLAVTGIDAVNKGGMVDAVCVKAFSADRDYKPGDAVRCTESQFKSWAWHGYVQKREK
jgi:hypothetical protein